MASDPLFSQPEHKHLVLKGTRTHVKLVLTKKVAPVKLQAGAEGIRDHNQSVQQPALVTSTTLSSTPISSEMIRQRQMGKSVPSQKKAEKDYRSLFGAWMWPPAQKMDGPLHLSQCIVPIEGWSYRQQSRELASRHCTTIQAWSCAEDGLPHSISLRATYIYFLKYI